MRLIQLTSVTLLLWATAAAAEITDVVDSYRAEVDEMLASHDAWLHSAAAPSTMLEAMQRGEVVWSQRYAGNWGGWLWVEWSKARQLYAAASHGLLVWQGAVLAGEVGEPEAETALANGMAVLRRINAHIEPWFSDDLDNWVERGLWLDRANAVGCCGEEYQFFHDMADRAFDDSQSPDYRIVGGIAVFPPVRGDETDPQDAYFASLNAAAESAVASGDPARIRAVLRSARLTLHLWDDPQIAELEQALHILDDRMRYAAAPVDVLLDRAAALPEGPVREAVLDAAEDGLLDRVGHLAPMLAVGALADAVERNSAQTQLIDSAKRLVQLRDDARNIFDRPSGASRFLSGLNAASQALDMANADDPQARESARIINDTAEAFPVRVSPVAPFSGPMGAVAGQLDQTKRAWDHASDALDGVAAAIGGDPGGLERAQAAARRLEDALDPRAFVTSMTEGFVEGVANNIPFARSIIGWLSE